MFDTGDDVFSTWLDPWPKTPSHYLVHPPRPVTINLSTAIIRDNPPLRTNLRLRVSAAGLNLTGTTTGVLHAWARLNTGTWLACCTFDVSTGNKRGHLSLSQWVPASSVQPIH